MLDDVAAAFDRRDYPTAARLLKTLLKQSPEDPWVQLYLGRLREASNQLDEAEAVYRQLLRHVTHPRLATLVRQGIQRVETTQRAQRQQAIAQATADPANSDLGFLVLEAVTGDARDRAISSLARVMKVDAYTARLLLPNRGWRLYRTGAIGELQVYGKALQATAIPTLWASVTELSKIQVFHVNYLQAIAPKVTLVCQNEHEQLGSISFEWSEVSQRVEGLLPVFEQVLALGYRDRLERKEKTQDYAQFCDLHLPKRRCILRFHDSHYNFHQGVAVLPQQALVDELDRHTIRTNWNGLMNLLDRQLPDTLVWSDFTTFAETAADFAAPLSRLKAHVHLLRQTDTFWDPAFHLYSTLIFLHRVVNRG